MSQSLFGNIRYALRQLVRSPGYAATVVLTLAVVTGANSAMFSAIDAILLRPLPFPDGDRLVRISEIREGVGETNIAPSRLNDWSKMNSTFEAISGYYTDSVVDTTGELPERLSRAVVAPGFLDVWGVAPARGRGFTAAEHSAGGPQVILLSDRLWRRRGADPNILNRTMRSGGLSFAVIGIMPESVHFPDHDADLWAPFPIDPPFTQSREPAWLTGIGRLKPGVTIDQASADLEHVQAQLAELYPDTDSKIGVRIEPLKDTVVGNARQSLWFLYGAVSVLLLIACTNIAALLLSRAADRESDISIRFSLGASRGAILRQTFIETSVLAGAGAALGVLVAEGAVNAFRIIAPDLPRVDEIALDGRLFLYTIASAVAVTLLCGAFPAVHSARRGVTLARGSRGQVLQRHSLQWLLVGVQITLSVALLSGAGLLVRSIEALSRVDLGFDATHVLTFSISGRFGEAGGYDGLVQRMNTTLDELAVLPGVEGVATSSMLPGVPGERQSSFDLVEGRAAAEPHLIAESRVVSPGYFATMRMPLIGGRVCERPTDSATQRELMVNESFVERYFPSRPVFGLHLAGDSGGRVVGVVGDAREEGASREPQPTVYECFSAPSAAPWFLVRTSGEPLAALRAIRVRIRELEPQRPVYDAASLEQRIGNAYSQSRLRMFLLVFFSVTALSLACLGIYATLGYIVNVRSREVGLRMALGAPWGTILVGFLLRVLRIVAFACALGLVLSTAFTRLLSSMLYGVSASDPITLAGVVLIVIAIALLAALFPSLRAARIDPMKALREK